MRVPGWQEALRQVMHEAHGRRFRWGRHDCCQFVARATAAITGIDRRDLFPVYRSKAEALAILAECGGYRGLLTRAFGEPVHVSRAGMGDVILFGTNRVELFDSRRFEFPALCMGLNSFAPGKYHLNPLPTSAAREAWLT